MTTESLKGASGDNEIVSNSKTLFRKPGILIVDDMGLILTLLKSVLEPLGFNVWLAMNGNDALDLYRRNRTQLDMVLLDVMIPGLDGPHTLRAMQFINPDVLACFMTGGSAMYTRNELKKCGAIHVFDKPFRVIEVARMLRDILQVYMSLSIRPMHKDQ